MSTHRYGPPGLLESRAYLGLGAHTVLLQRRTVLLHGLDVPSAVGVDQVEPPGPVDRAGLRQGDRIVSVDGLPTPDGDTLHRLMNGERVGCAASV